MIVATLDAALLAQERSLANYMLRTRRPELFGELIKDQVSSLSFLFPRQIPVLLFEKLFSALTGQGVSA